MEIIEIKSVSVGVFEIDEKSFLVGKMFDWISLSKVVETLLTFLAVF